MAGRFLLLRILALRLSAYRVPCCGSERCTVMTMCARIVCRSPYATRLPMRRCGVRSLAIGFADSFYLSPQINLQRKGPADEVSPASPGRIRLLWTGPGSEHCHAYLS